MVKSGINLLHNQGDGQRPGLIKSSNGLVFTCEICASKAPNLVIYSSDNKVLDRVDMSQYQINSSLASVEVTNVPDDFSYMYECDGESFMDPYAANSIGIRAYGNVQVKDRGTLYIDDFEWGDDRRPSHKYSDVIAYQLHVRGFTKHSTSKEKEKSGTFAGIVSKIPYLLDLGINQIVLMPSYDFNEYDSLDRKYPGKDKEINQINIKSESANINYWGFKEGYYYKPKSSYAVHNAVYEYKYMVRELHKAGIEVIMRFYFPDDYNISKIPDVLHFWSREYHVDGFFIMGSNIPVEMIASDLYLMDSKLYFQGLNEDSIHRMSTVNSNIACANNGFSVASRKYLKSDENMLQEFLYYQRHNPSYIHSVNYITDYSGFTLNDLVSYDYKHNEDNNEGNNDGENFNFSWNCGVEGVTRKKAVNALRMRQIKNAFAFLILAQGIPMILAGDEMLNTQNGNNNAYCQDNSTGWLEWKNNKNSEEVMDFVKKLIWLRKKHPILHMQNEFRIMDYAACGFPDLSYHGDNAWSPSFDNHIRYIGVMICGKYARINHEEDDFFYIAYNMHWENHNLALPKLPKNKKWHIEMTTLDDEEVKRNEDKCTLLTDDHISVSGRTVVILKTVNID